MNAVELDDLAERMLGPAAKLVPAVHRSNAAEVQAVLGRLSVPELRALVVVLANLVPDDHALSQLVEWTREPPPVSKYRAAANRALLEAELAADFQARKAARWGGGAG